ncbi:hypothetical protein S-CBP2_0044 [Synechococcus phage S-CBP2]|uniref:DUF7936 domain-containing protein n=1 Tax=Synechococcus phage S-CBP2 TaxID=756277 RepID=A0A096VL11_9CAUD|nr:hypothetical protein S-CBP2_0044 [Synechococcus phage S-CBP2]AGF91074.1 hypothetical protein SXHG_00052 [Synechococcus phage MRHenn-2013a]AGK86750.1 hypothetical protein S-CBP2_0044 [Synechococcus phage S-CBP2]
MANTYTWAVSNLEREVQSGKVTTVHYTVDAVSDDGVYSAGAYGSIGLSGDVAIPFASLTAETCVQWVKDALTAEKVAEVEAVLDRQLDEQRAPSTAVGVPW